MYDLGTTWCQTSSQARHLNGYQPCNSHGKLLCFSPMKSTCSSDTNGLGCELVRVRRCRRSTHLQCCFACLKMPILYSMVTLACYACVPIVQYAHVAGSLLIVVDIDRPVTSFQMVDYCQR